MAAALAAFFMLMILAVAISAGEPEPLHDANPAEDTTILEETLTGRDVLPENGAEAKQPSSVPPGTGTVIDYYIDAEGKVFYTVMTEDKHVFYLIIDQDRNTQNVYFLNSVTIADLAALAEFPLPVKDGACECEHTPTNTATPTPAPSGGNNMGIFLIAAGIIVIGAFGVWYFKVYRPKQLQTMRSLEYVPPVAEKDDTDYSDGWDEDADDTGEGAEE